MPAPSPSRDSTVVNNVGLHETPTAVLQPSSGSSSNEKSNHTSSKKMIDASGEIRPSSDVLDFMKSLEAQDNINIVENTAPPRSTTVLPGAYLVGPSHPVPEEGAIPIEATHEYEDDNMISAAVDAPTMIVAHLAPDEEDIRAMYHEQLETEVRMRLALVTTDATIVVADEVKKDDAPIPRPAGGSNKGTTKRWLIMALLVCLVVGAGLGGVISWVLQDDEEQGGRDQNEQQEDPDPLVMELKSFIAPTADDLLVFLDPESPQSQALAWLREDPITMTPGRSSEIVLERYVLAVLYYTTAGPKWKQFPLSDSDHCTWNKALVWSGEIVYDGVLCAADEDATTGGGRMESLHLGGNNLFGSLPWELVLLTSLKSIILDDNVVTGSLPTRITELTRLERFWAWSNRLTGTMPALFSPHMLDIDLSKNLFTGTLPERWGTEMPSIREIRVFENALTGTLPTTMGLLSNLTLFSTYSNLMTGTVPTELGLLRSLQVVDIRMNSLTGSVNETLCLVPEMLAVMEADCDEVECPCCTVCCFNNAMGACDDMTEGAGGGGGGDRL
jgi:hypothetical protein